MKHLESALFCHQEFLALEDDIFCENLGVESVLVLLLQRVVLLGEHLVLLGGWGLALDRFGILFDDLNAGTFFYHIFC